MLLVLGDGALFKMLLAKPFALSIPATPVSLVKVCIAFLCITRLAVGGTASFEKVRFPSTRGRHRAPAVSPESSRCVYRSLCTQSPAVLKPLCNNTSKSKSKSTHHQRQTMAYARAILLRTAFRSRVCALSPAKNVCSHSGAAGFLATTTRNSRCIMPSFRSE